MKRVTQCDTSMVFTWPIPLAQLKRMPARLVKSTFIPFDSTPSDRMFLMKLNSIDSVPCK